MIDEITKIGIAFILGAIIGRLEYKSWFWRLDDGKVLVRRY